MDDGPGGATGIRPSTRPAWVAGIAGSIAVAGYFVLGSATVQNIAYLVIGVGSTAAMVIGVRRNRPPAGSGWYLLIAGNLLSILGDGIENIVYAIVLNRAVPLPSVADISYLSAYPVIFFGLARVYRVRTEEGSGENFADAATVAVAALALSWQLLMGSYLHRTDLSQAGRLVGLMYPIMDLGLLFIALRSLVFGGGVFGGSAFARGRLTVYRILTVSLTAMLISDSAYAYLTQHGGYNTGNIIDAGWLINYLLMGVAALHPSMAAEPGSVVPRPAVRPRIPVLTLAGFVAPTILLVSSLTHTPVDTPVIAGSSIAVFALLALRMTWLFQHVRAQTWRAEADAAALADSLATRERLELNLRHQANHDPLTGLANRALLHERVTTALENLRGTERLIVLLFCDLDGFKTVNDSLGHHSGDRLLRVIGGRLEQIIRGSDTVARFGGDEFAVLVNPVDSMESAVAIADRIVAAMREPVEVAGRQITVSVSVGMAIGTAGKDPEQLLSEADVAMYSAKAKGKGRWETFEVSMQRRSVERLELSNSFRGALERAEFHLLYQPLFSFTDGRLVGFEALMRWSHPSLGLIEPNRFIPLAEETGFMIPLGRWALAQACDQAAAWSSAVPSLTMSVNVSGRQLREAGLRDDISTALSLSGLDPHRLVLDITETNLVADSKEARGVLAELKDLGVKIALDDFGTGYSSMSYLRRLPLDILKIDRSFVEPLGYDGAQEKAMVSTIIDFARILGLATVAEGVDLQAQYETLVDLGCDTAQGFLLSPPLDPESAERLVAGEMSSR